MSQSTAATRTKTKAAQVEDLQAQLEELHETLRAIRLGNVDALLVPGPEGDHLYVRKGAEQPYRIFIETMHEGAVTLLPDGTIAYCNGRFAQLVDTPLQRVIGAHLGSFVPPGYRHKVQPLITLALQGYCSETIRFLGPDGVTIWAELSLSPVQLENAPGVCMVVTDITERKKSEELRSYLASIVDSTDDAIVGITLDGIIISWNPGAQRLWAYTPEEVIGYSMNRLILPENTAMSMALLSSVGRGEVVESFETTVVRKGGQRINVFLTVSPVRNAEGLIAGVSTIGRDVTQRKRAEAELVSQARELERSNNELQQFAYVASHDLQEPLRTVASFTKLLADRYQGTLDADADEYLGYITQSASRAQCLIQDLLAFSRVGTRAAEFTCVSCESVLKMVLANLATAIKETGGKVTHAPLPFVRGDKSQLAQLFQNLIGNALKFHGNQRPRVHISTHPLEQAIRFSIQDNGIGIDPRFQDHVFAVFRRLHSAADYPGTGIGLAIARKIIERHSGQIWFESTPGQGTTFFFTLPLA